MHPCYTHSFLVFILLNLFFIINGKTISPPLVNIQQGIVSGFYLKTINNRQILGFQGIPFAAPPVGNLRFKEPIPAKPWLGIYNATSRSNICMQYSHGTYKEKNPIIGLEDCLYLDVYTPYLPNTTKNLMEVLVYIHGGAFMYGTGTSYTPDYLLDQDIVLVTIHYRLGILGFLSTEDSVLPGNNGMKDQVLAMKWVKRNIKAFGGNPLNITIAGMSAGGASVHFHMLSPLSKGLFNRAISLSGSAFSPWAIMENSREKTLRLADYMGCQTKDSSILVECLQQRPATRLVEAARIFMTWLYCPFSPLAITIEPKSPTAFISELPIVTILRKEASDVPWLLTFDRDEGLYPGAEILSNPKYIEEIDDDWEKLSPHLLHFNYTVPQKQLAEVSNKIRQFYLKNKRVKDDWQNFVKMIGDRNFFTSIGKAGKLQASHYESPVYAYMFSYFGSRTISEMFIPRTSIYRGICHGDDLSYVLRANYMPLDDSKQDLEMSKRLVNIWTTFIKGKPMPTKWPAINDTLPNFTYLKISSPNPEDDEIIQDDNFGNEEFWSTLPLHEDIIQNFKVSKKDEL